jgi:hypothetical protein
MPDVPEIWPRLEDGALICKSRDDLVRYQTQIGNGASTTTAGQASACHTIQKQTGIQILGHDGPSRTQIATTDESKETGWTNSYLPSTPPRSVAKSNGAGKWLPPPPVEHSTAAFFPSTAWHADLGQAW